MRRKTPRGESKPKQAEAFYSTHPFTDTNGQRIMFFPVEERQSFRDHLVKQKQFSPAAIQRILGAFDYMLVGHGHDASKDRVRMSGEPYATHPLAIARSVAQLGGTEHHITAALLHDVAEASADPRNTIAGIRQRFGAKVADTVDLLTKREDEEYEEHLERIIDSGDLVALYLKFQDIAHNLSTAEYLPPQRQKKVLKKYLKPYTFAAKFDPELADYMRHIYERHGLTVPHEKVNRRLVLVSPREEYGSALIKRLPRADAHSIVYYRPKERSIPGQPYRLTVGMPVRIGNRPDLTREFWEKALLEIRHNGGSITAATKTRKRLPRLVGHREHIELTVNGIPRRDLQRLLRNLHEEHLPEWRPT